MYNQDKLLDAPIKNTWRYETNSITSCAILNLNHLTKNVKFHPNIRRTLLQQLRDFLHKGHTFFGMYVFMYVCVYAYMNVCIYVYVHNAHYVYIQCICTYYFVSL